MTDSSDRKRLYVASATMRAAHEFGRGNDFLPTEVFWLGDTWRAKTVPFGSNIWVIGEIGSETAEIIDFLIQTRQIKLKYAEIDSKVSEFPCLT